MIFQKGGIKVKRLNILSIGALCLGGMTSPQFNLSKFDEEIKNKGTFEDYSSIVLKYQNTFNDIIKNFPNWNLNSIQFAKEIDIINSNDKKALYVDFDFSNDFLVLMKKIYLKSSRQEIY